MATVAEQLRLAREQYNLTVQQVTELTKIKTDHIHALESGNYECFSAPVYVRGFVRTYATVLKLEVPRLMADLDAELRHSSKLREPPPLTNPAGGWLDFLMLYLSRLNWRIAVAALAVAGLLLGGYVALRLRQQARAADPLAGLGAGLYQPKNPAGGELLPLPTNPPPR